ncbi:MAG: GxxExxY protein [Planctomycetaceae bacterium]
MTDRGSIAKQFSDNPCRRLDRVFSRGHLEWDETMPVHVQAQVRRLDQEEFGRIAYEIMRHVFAVHNAMGRCFREDVYRDAVAGRMPSARTEVPVQVRFEDFAKDYYIDLLVEEGAVFELKSVETIGPAQRAQLLNYLLLTGLSHGKLVNFSGDRVEHQFVNSHLRLTDRTAFEVVDRHWCDPGAGDRPLKPWLVGLLRDIGAGLHVHLYASAVSHLFGGDEAVLREIDISIDGRPLRRQKIRLAAPEWGFEVTAIEEPDLPRFEEHLHRSLGHTSLRGTHWINITRKQVTFMTVPRQ